MGSLSSLLKGIGDKAGVNPPAEEHTAGGLDALPTAKPKTKCPTCGESFAVLAKHKCTKAAEPIKAEPEPIKAEPEPIKAEPEPIKAEPEPIKGARPLGVLIGVGVLKHSSPVGVLAGFATEVGAIGRQLADSEGMGHWNEAEFGQGSPRLAAAWEAWLTAHPNVDWLVVEDPHTPEWRACATITIARATFVVRGVC